MHMFPFPSFQARPLSRSVYSVEASLATQRLAPPPPLGGDTLRPRPTHLAYSRMTTQVVSTWFCEHERPAVGFIFQRDPVGGYLIRLESLGSWLDLCHVCVVLDMTSIQQ